MWNVHVPYGKEKKKTTRTRCKIKSMQKWWVSFDVYCCCHSIARNDELQSTVDYTFNNGIQLGRDTLTEFHMASAFKFDYMSEFVDRLHRFRHVRFSFLAMQSLAFSWKCKLADRKQSSLKNKQLQMTTLCHAPQTIASDIILFLSLLFFFDKL